MKQFFFKGVVRGKISSEPRGKYGFHYDPIFIPKGSEKTFGEMSIEEKIKLVIVRVQLMN